MVIATSLTLVLRPQGAGLLTLVLLFGFLAYLLVQVNYGLFALVLTPYIIFLLELAGAPEPSLVRHRALDTILGGALAIVGHAVLSWITRPPRREAHA